MTRLTYKTEKVKQRGIFSGWMTVTKFRGVYAIKSPPFRFDVASIIILREYCWTINFIINFFFP